MKNFLMKRSTQIAVGSSVAVATVFGFFSIAGATAYDPTTALTGLASSATSTAAPIMVAVAVALIPLLIVFLIIGWVFGLFGRKRRV